MRRVFPTVLTMIIFFAPAILSGCSVPSTPPGVAVVLVEAYPRHLDPVHAADAVSQRIGNLIHGALVRFDSNMKLQGELAESWRVEKYRRFVFKLRERLAFQDGTPITAEDVVRSVREFTTGGPHAAAYAHIKKVRAISAREVELETDIAQPFLLSDLPLVKIFKRQKDKVIGAGPYELEAEVGNEVRLRASSKVAAAIPPDGLQRVVFRHVADDTTRYQQLIRGDANVAPTSLSLMKTLELVRNTPPTLKITEAPGVNFTYLCMNLRDPRLANLKVRQAIAHAIDYDSLLKYRIGGFGRRATGILSAAHSDYYEPDVQRHDFDRAKAERLLDEAGFARKPKDGWRFELTFKTTTEKFGNELARIIANDLRQVGIDVRVEIVEQGVFWSELKQANFQLFHSRWVGVTNPSIYYRVFHSSQIGKGVNRGGYVNAKMDQLIDKAMNEVDDGKRRRYFSDIQKLAARDLPYVNLWHWNNVFIGSSKMRDVVLYPTGDYRTLTHIRDGEPK